MIIARELLTKRKPLMYSVVALLLLTGASIALLTFHKTSTNHPSEQAPAQATNKPKQNVASAPPQNETPAKNDKPKQATAPTTNKPNTQQSNSPSPTVPTSPTQPTTPKNCAASPRTCGYPDATNTGWQHTGVTLTVINQDPYYINTPGAVIDGKDIRGCVFVRAPNVTIKRSKISCSNQPMVKTYEPDGRGGLTDLAKGLVIEDTEFDGLGDPDSTGVAFNHYTVRRSNFHRIGSASRVGTNVVVEDNYVHDIAYTSSSHNGGFPSDGGSGITIRHNTVFMNSSNGYTLSIYNWVPAGNVVQDVLVENNLLAGGNYIIYCGAPGHITPNLRVVNNRFSRLYYAKGGYYGHAANCNGATAWTGNVWDDTLSAVTP